MLQEESELECHECLEPAKGHVIRLHQITNLPRDAAPESCMLQGKPVGCSPCTHQQRQSVTLTGVPACLGDRTQGNTGLLDRPGLPLLRTSNSLILVGHAPVKWHQCTTGDWKLQGLPQYSLWLYRVKSLRLWGPGGVCPILTVQQLLCWLVDKVQGCRMYWRQVLTDQRGIVMHGCSEHCPHPGYNSKQTGCVVSMSRRRQPHFTYEQSRAR